MSTEYILLVILVYFFSSRILQQAWTFDPKEVGVAVFSLYVDVVQSCSLKRVYMLTPLSHKTWVFSKRVGGGKRVLHPLHKSFNVRHWLHVVHLKRDTNKKQRLGHGKKKFFLIYILNSFNLPSQVLSISSPQYIDSACLEPTTLQEEPVKYHEAWQKLCSAEWVLEHPFGCNTAWTLNL